MDGRRLRTGSLKLFPEVADDVRAQVIALESEGKTVLLLGDEGGPHGLIAVADRVRENAPSVISDLRKAGVEHAVILTGDNERVAASVAAQVGADRFDASLQPRDKVGAIGHGS